MSTHCLDEPRGDAPLGRGPTRTAARPGPGPTTGEPARFTPQRLNHEAGI